jgi:predicted nucleic acid-binding protein
MRKNAEAYLDASVLVALLSNDPHTPRADAFMRSRTPVVIVSDFAAAEFVSAIARRVRIGEIAADEARIGFTAFDAWTARVTRRELIKSADVSAAAAYLRRLDVNLRTADALNIAIAQRVGAILVTFDEKMAASARMLGVPTEEARIDGR